MATKKEAINVEKIDFKSLDVTEEKGEDYIEGIKIGLELFLEGHKTETLNGIIQGILLCQEINGGDI